MPSWLRGFVAQTVGSRRFFGRRAFEPARVTLGGHRGSAAAISRPPIDPRSPHPQPAVGPAEGVLAEAGDEVQQWLAEGLGTPVGHEAVGGGRPVVAEQLPEFGEVLAAEDQGRVDAAAGADRLGGGPERIGPELLADRRLLIAAGRGELRGRERQGFERSIDDRPAVGRLDRAGEALTRSSRSTDLIGVRAMSSRISSLRNARGGRSASRAASSRQPYSARRTARLRGSSEPAPRTRRYCVSGSNR